MDHNERITVGRQHLRKLNFQLKEEGLPVNEAEELRMVRDMVQEGLMKNISLETPEAECVRRRILQILQN